MLWAGTEDFAEWIQQQMELDSGTGLKNAQTEITGRRALLGHES